MGLLSLLAPDLSTAAGRVGQGSVFTRRLTYHLLTEFPPVVLMQR
jgi:hypothetical protein